MKKVHVEVYFGWASYLCPYCEVLTTTHRADELMIKEISRKYYEPDIATITYSFECKVCEGKLQTTKDINKDNKIVQ